jgi:hypothetical protein
MTRQMHSKFYPISAVVLMAAVRAEQTLPQVEGAAILQKLA